MRQLQDADKNGWTVAAFSVMMVTVDLGPQQIRRTDCLSDQMSQRLIHRYLPSDVRPTLFSDDSRFQLFPDDHRRRVWRRPGQRADPVLPIPRHTHPQPGDMVWGAISFDSPASLVIIRGTLTA
ncbi:uncharacterized protein TNCV_388461 [Trichonephila clavipes]|nr:uncharacterized protein TNCV_388461 [Trichonephila clavipes]